MDFAIFTFLFGLQVGVIIGIWIEQRERRKFREFVNKLKELRNEPTSG